MSIQLLMSENQAFASAGMLATMLIGRLCTGIDWGDIDYLIVDLPPGTGEITQAVVEALRVSAALVVVTPQAAAHLDTRKLLAFFGQRDVRVVGGVENMTGTLCPECGHEFQLFVPEAEHRTIWDDGVSRLVSMPFDAAAASDGWPGKAGQAAGRFRVLAERLEADLTA
jgi:ATP-binding protein involved in chromosome partitioning